MPDSEPTLGEIMRRLDDVSKRFEDTVKEVRDFRSWAERLYVPRGEWVEGRRADQSVVADLSRDVETMQTKERQKETEDRAFRRQMALGLIVCGVGTIGSLIVALLMFVLNGGPS